MVLGKFQHQAYSPQNYSLEQTTLTAVKSAMEVHLRSRVPLDPAIFNAKGQKRNCEFATLGIYARFWSVLGVRKGMKGHEKAPLHSVWKSSNNKRLTHHWEQEGLDSQQLRSKPSANFRRLSAPFASGLPWSNFMSLVGWASFALSWWSWHVYEIFHQESQLQGMWLRYAYIDVQDEIDEIIWNLRNS